MLVIAYHGYRLYCLSSLCNSVFVLAAHNLFNMHCLLYYVYSVLTVYPIYIVVCVCHYCIDSLTIFVVEMATLLQLLKAMILALPPHSSECVYISWLQWKLI